MWCRYRARSHTEDIGLVIRTEIRVRLGQTSVDRCPNPSVQYTPTQPVVTGFWVIVNSCYNQSLNHYTITGLCLCSLENLIAVVGRFGFQPTPKSPSSLQMHTSHHAPVLCARLKWKLSINMQVSHMLASVLIKPSNSLWSALCSVSTICSWSPWSTSAPLCVGCDI